MRKVLNYFVLTLTPVLLFFTCSGKYSALQTVPKVDLNRYAGLWYEISAFPQKFQKGCRCTTAEYESTDKGYIRVINKCQKPNKFSTAEGKAFIVKGSGNAKLKVQFFWPFKGDYWIIELDPDYKWAVVGDESRKYLWVLSRTPVMKEEVYNNILQKVKEKKFDISKLKKTIHDCK